MNIAIDLDQTYTADPDMWDSVIECMRSAGHDVFMVTCRPSWDIAGMEQAKEIFSDEEIFFTDNRAKIEYMETIPFHIDIWIDDTPATVTGGGKVMYRKNEDKD